MTDTPMSAGPYRVVVEGSAFSSWIGFATAEEAYAEAHRIKGPAEEGEMVAFTNFMGSGGNYIVRGIRIFRWNPLTQTELAHARSWTITNPAADALTPLPAEWHLELNPLPDDWFV